MPAIPPNEKIAGQKIVLLGDPILETPASELITFDAALDTLIDRMFDTMRAAKGVGLAAPQIGHSLRVCVIEVPGRDRIALVNPFIVQSEGEATEEEGCLSIPGFREPVKRHATVTVRGLSRRGNWMRIEAQGLLARALQHEIDHLDGVLFIKHLNQTRERVIRRRFRRALEKLKKR